MWVKTSDLVPSTSSSLNTAEVLPWLKRTHVTYENKTLFLFKSFFFIPFLLLETHLFFPKLRDCWDFLSEFWLPSHLRPSLTMCWMENYWRSLQQQSEPMCQDNEKQFCSSSCSASCVCHKWVVEIWSEWSISYWTVLFYCWQLKVTEKQGQCQTVSNWKPLINVRCWLVLLDEIRTSVEWILLYRMSWLISLPFQCFFNLISPLILW